MWGERKFTLLCLRYDCVCVCVCACILLKAQKTLAHPADSNHSAGEDLYVSQRREYSQRYEYIYYTLCICDLLSDYLAFFSAFVNMCTSKLCTPRILGTMESCPLGGF